jgi:hypothetical protein
LVAVSDPYLVVRTLHKQLKIIATASSI